MAARAFHERPPVTVLGERRAHAVAIAQSLSTLAGTLLETSAELCTRATDLRLAALEVRRRQAHDGRLPVQPRRDECGWFTVRGIVDGRPTTARWRPGQLDCDREVTQRALVIVAMGERFIPPGRVGPTLDASVEGPPVAVLLTIMRAFSSVTSLDLSDELFDSLDRARP